MPGRNRYDRIADRGTEEIYLGAFYRRAVRSISFKGGGHRHLQPVPSTAGEEQEEGKIGEFSSWRTIKPVCFSLIRGKRLPETFRIVLCLSEEARSRFVQAHAPGILPEQAGGLYINIQYENQEMTCVTGTSMNVFTMDRTLEREWDESVKQFLKRSGIAFTC